MQSGPPPMKPWVIIGALGLLAAWIALTVFGLLHW